MNELENLLIWYALDEDGDPNRIVKLDAIPAGRNLDEWFAKWSEKTDYRAANVWTVTKKHIKVPAHIQDVEGVAFILHFNGVPHRAILPYYVMIEED